MPLGAATDASSTTAARPGVGSSKWGIKADGVFEEKIEALEPSDNLFLKPKTNPASVQAYQCILNYAENGDEYPAVVIHVSLAPKGEPPRVRVAVHPSDTVKTRPSR